MNKGLKTFNVLLTRVERYVYKEKLDASKVINNGGFKKVGTIKRGAKEIK